MKRIFLSVAHDDVSNVEELKRINKSRRNIIEYVDKSPDLSIDSEDADNIKQKAIQKIVNAQITICLVGEETYKSEWVNWELERSDEAGNEIIAMAAKGTSSAILPKLVKEKRLKFYNWNPRVLYSLIEE